MIEKTVMETLSRELSEAERDKMFRRIRQEIIQTEVDSATVEIKEDNKQERLKLIKKDMSSAGLWEKFIVWIKSSMTGKTKEDIFASRKLITLKRQIARKAPGITGFETRNLTPKLASVVFDVYKSAVVMKKSFSDLWIKEGNLEKIIVYLLLERIKENRGRLEDFITMEDMVQIYRDKGQKEKIREELLKRIQDYTDTIPEEEFTKAENELEPFYFLKEIVLFPYVAFFQLFGFNPAAMPDVKAPFFHNASAMLSLNFLEKLHYAGECNSLLDDNIVIETSTIKAILELAEPEEDPFKDAVETEGSAMPDFRLNPDTPRESKKDQVSPEDDIPEILREEKLKNYLADLNELHKKLVRFHRSIPCQDLLRFFHKDPYYMVRRKLTGLHFSDFYYMILKNSAVTRLNELYPEVKKLYIQSEIEELFKGKTFFTLQNYRMYTSIDYDKMGLPFFRHTRSINLLYNYIKVFYRSYFYDTFQLLDKSILVGNRIVRDKLESSTTSFEEIAQRIMEFDYSMSPDSDDGKLFQRLRFSMAGESSHQKMFRTLVLQKDKEVKSLLERGDEDIANLIKLLNDLLTSPEQTIKTQLNTHYILRGKSVMLANLLKNRKQHLIKFRALLSQITKEERY